MSCDLTMGGAASAVPHRSAGMLEFRQLRHQTKNALQRIVMQVLELSGLDDNRPRGDIGREVMRRIELTAAISDALFGLRQSPGPLPARLKSLSQSVVALHDDGIQHIDLDFAISGGGKLSRRREDAILRITHELVMNAVRHGMYNRIIGRISVRLDVTDDGRTLLSIGNDGWTMAALPHHGGGLQIVEELANTEGGSVRIKIRPQTLFEASLPPETHSSAKENCEC